MIRVMRFEWVVRPRNGPSGFMGRIREGRATCGIDVPCESEGERESVLKLNGLAGAMSGCVDFSLGTLCPIALGY